MADETHRFQPPKGTRDFYPADMAVRRYIESIWREVSISHGFEEIDGPTFEHLEMYTTKSGPGIVSELFSFRREGGDVDYALRPEFTPTLARMYGARAAQLPKPVKWFCIESNFRAERPQRGRLREFFQWNADILGDASPRADAEVIAVTVGVLERLGVTPEQVQIKINDRGPAVTLLRNKGVAEENIEPVLELVDKLDRLDAEEIKRRRDELGVSEDLLRHFGADVLDVPVDQFEEAYREAPPALRRALENWSEFHERIRQEIEDLGIAKWCRLNIGIVRGLAYYTGTVFEVHEVSGGERAIAGGGRYDELVELFGGPKTPAVGIAMGDVVLRLLLEERGLLKAEEHMPRPDVFVISAGGAELESALVQMVSELRRQGLHARHSYRATRNVGKLLGEASKVRARLAVILGEELAEGNVVVKDLESGEQQAVPRESLAAHLERAVSRQVGQALSGG